MRKSALLSALLLGAALFTANSASADPARWHGGRAWHGGHPVAHNRFVFHHDFRHFTPVEHRAWVGGHWHHSWWHGRYGWWWGVGGAFYFYNAPIYPYPAYVSPTYYDDDSYDGGGQGYGDDQGYGGGDYPPGGPDAYQGGGYPGGGAGVWYHCSSPEGYYPYIRTCRNGWQQVPATPGDMQGGPPPGGPGGPGGPDDNGPPQGGPYQDDQNGPPPPGR